MKLKQSLLGIALSQLMAHNANAQSTYTYSTTSTSTGWIRASNWSGGDTGKMPGVDGSTTTTVDGNAGDIAQFGVTAFSGSQIQINFGTNGNNGTTNANGAAVGQLSLGAISFLNTVSKDLSIGKSDTSTTAAALTLNGSAINSVANVILSNADNNTLTLAGFAGGSGTAPMSLALGNSTDNNVLISGTGGITIASIISGSSRNLTLQGGGTGALTLSGINTYSGTTTIKTGTLALGVNGSIDNSPSIVVGDTGSSGTVLNTTAKTGFTVLSTQTLSGIGTVDVGAGKTLTVSGTHAPGNGGVGSQAVTGNLAYGATSIFSWDLNENSISSGFDTVTGASAVSVTAGAVFNVILGAGVDKGASFWSTPSTTKTWSLATIFGVAPTGSFTLGTVAGTTPAFNALGSFSVTPTSLVWTAVPEPSSAFAGLLLGAGLLRRRRVA
jgi:fibronectin-binding autotransporter adhesin